MAAHRYLAGFSSEPSLLSCSSCTLQEEDFSSCSGVGRAHPKSVSGRLRDYAVALYAINERGYA